MRRRLEGGAQVEEVVVGRSRVCHLGPGDRLETGRGGMALGCRLMDDAIIH